MHFQQSILFEILAPAVFDYEDSKSESWHSAKKIREVFLDYKSPRHFLLYKNIVISFGGAVVQIKNYLQTVKREKFFRNFAWKSSVLLNMHSNFVSFTNKRSAIKFCKASLSTANFINFELARCYSNKRKNKRYKQRR